MIFTARQLDDLHKSNGHVTLPVGARLTPMAADWLRAKSIVVKYGEDRAPEGAGLAMARSSEGGAFASSSSTPAPAGVVLWWCDGPCGPAKAALSAQGRETNLQPMTVTAEPKYLVAAIKHLAKEVKNDRAVSGVLLVQSGAAAVVYANRCPSLRAILGTCRETVQQGIDLVGANVLVVETPYQTLQQVRNVLSLFVRMRREPSDDVRRQLQEMTSCA
jgi:ribose 5-phosphate isomerase RpiB